jgi:hypothetical protein
MGAAGLLLILLLLAAVLFAVFVPALLAMFALGQALLAKKSRSLWAAGIFAVIAAGMALGVSHLLFAGAGGLTSVEQAAVLTALVLSLAAVVTLGVRYFHCRRQSNRATP